MREVDTKKQLVHCPFCGFDDQLKIAIDNRDFYYIVCQFCHTFQDKKYKNLDDAVNAWNTRPIENDLANKVNLLNLEVAKSSGQIIQKEFEISNLKEEIKGYKLLFRKMNNLRNASNLLNEILNDVTAYLQ